jgi:hypothetical protein
MSNWTENNPKNISNPKYDPSTHQFKKGWIDGHPRGGYPANYFFADSIRSVMIGFGNFFNDLFVIRYDEKGEPIKQIQVPLKYGPRMKSHDFRVEQETGKKYYIQLPNMTYRKTGMAFASERYSGAGETRGFYSKYFEVNGVDYLMANKFWADVHPVPYNITISMEAKCEHISDANQIEEQVLSRFAPEAYFDLKEFWFINKRRSIKMKLDSISEEITQDFGEEDKREITVSFEFTIEAWLYKTIKDTYIIDEIITQLGVNGDKNYWNEKMMGNYTGNFKERHDFDYQFGTKIGHVSAMLPFEKQPEPVSSTTGWFYEYKYEELPDITNYPAGSKLLLTKTIRNDETSAKWNPINQYLTSLSSTAPVTWNDKTYDALHRDGSVLQYWQVTANSGDWLNGSANFPKPSLSGDRIYKIYYNPNYVVASGTLKSDGTVDKPGVFGGTFVEENENLKGFGNFTDNLFFGTKDADVGGTVVKDAPWVSQISTENNEII